MRKKIFFASLLDILEITYDLIILLLRLSHDTRQLSLISYFPILHLFLYYKQL